MKHLDLFSGLGGFTLGLERAGFETVAFCEIEEYPRKVLAKHWPDVPIYRDIRELTGERLQADRIVPDIITGGFPCQDISVAGSQAGIDGERSGLWSELCRIIGEVRPRYALMENVTNLISGDRGRWFQRVLGDLAEIGYDAEWHCISAAHIGAPHIRDRVWIFAYPSIDGRPRPRLAWPRWDGSQNSYIFSDADYCKQSGEQPGAEKCDSSLGSEWEQAWRTPVPAILRMAHGIPNRSHRIRGLGNAVVPQIPEMIGRAIMEANHD